MNITRKTFDEVMFQCYKPMNMVVAKAHGAKVTDTEGKEYIDFTSGIAVNCLGHTPKGVQKVVKKQVGELIHCSNVFTNVRTLELAKKLTKKTSYDRVFFVNSGAEANEAALKLARRAAFNDFGADKNEIISFNNSFHGRTLFSVSVGGQDKYSDGFGPKPAAITHLPFNDLKTFEKAVSDKTCAVIVEPVQGEGGIVPADKKFLEGLRSACTKHHAMLIFDEIQTGIGRTGTFFCYEQTGVKPDAVTFAKGIASGLPLGGVLTYDNFAKHFSLGTHGSTFGGNPLACAVGSYIVDTVGDRDFLDEVKAKGQSLVKAIEKLNQKYKLFKEIRGKGLLIGCVLVDGLKGKSGELMQCCFKHGLLTLVAGHDVLRIAPPLNLKDKAKAQGLLLLEQALEDFAKTVRAETKAAVKDTKSKAADKKTSVKSTAASSASAKNSKPAASSKKPAEKMTSAKKAPAKNAKASDQKSPAKKSTVSKK